MNQAINQIWAGWEGFSRLCECISGGAGPASVFGVGEGAAPFLIAALLEKLSRQCMLVTATETEAEKLYEAMLLLEKKPVLLRPRENRLDAFMAASRELSQGRAEALWALTEKKADILVTSAPAVMQVMTPPEVFVCSGLTLEVGAAYKLEELLTRLIGAGYERVDRAEAPGQIRLSGGILDVCPPWGMAVRAEFFDDELDSLRTYDRDTQRSVENLTKVEIPPADEAPLDASARKKLLTALTRQNKHAGITLQAQLDEIIKQLERDLPIESADRFLTMCYRPATVVDYLNSSAALFLIEPNKIEQTLNGRFEQFREMFAQRLEDGVCLAKQGELVLTPGHVREALARPYTVSLQSFSRVQGIPPKLIESIDAVSAPRYSSALPALAKDLLDRRKGAAVIIYAGERAQRLKESLLDLGVEAAWTEELTKVVHGQITIVSGAMCPGFECPALKVMVLSEEDVYASRKRPVKTTAKGRGNSFELFSELKPGDAVVHESYGIGMFMGIESISTEGKTRDYLKIQYSGTDKLFVPTDQLDRVQKYIGPDGSAPKLSKLNGGDWDKKVAKVKKAVRELAIDLAKLYADRHNMTGYAFSPDTLWQRQLEDAFEYRETRDQLRCVEEIKRDMESPRAMDRLLCGDVGYGKTEVAIRAMFKAVQDSKQVALLVPTTILAQQHYNTIKNRLEGLPVSVELMNRFRSPGQQKETLKRLKDGRCDILVGTHRILGRDVVYKDLGLLIIDEEHRFGVAHKEQIKDIKRAVDVLTLSATPIPRTLHMSMTGIRDMSVIETPPEDRYPAQTYVMEYSPEIVREAIAFELGRAGQVYVVYNTVRDMERFAGELAALLPQARIVLAHGQMPQTELENAMMAFIDRQADVLVCSTIIESGLDIPAANTMIIVDADKLGLSQLYQLRGRVGRSNRMAYAYLTFRRGKVLSEVAEKRLRAIREFTEFGAGFKIAMRDLEIRGAGNLLGADQHGHMSEVGYDYYCKLVEEAVREVRGQEAMPAATQLDIPVDAHIPESYIQSQARRLEAYKRIAAMETIEDRDDVTDELTDRFGDIPRSVSKLMDVAMLKSAASRARVEYLYVRAGEIRLRFQKGADVDGAKLLGLLNGYKKTSISAKEPVQVFLWLKNLSFDETVEQSSDFVQKLFHCIHGAQLV